MNDTERFNKLMPKLNKMIQEILKNENMDVDGVLRDEFNVYFDALNLAITFTPEIPITLYYENIVLPYKKYIESDDSEYFMSNYKKLIKEQNIDADNTMLIFFDKLQKIWFKLNQNNKYNLWKFIRAISVLAKNNHK